MIKSLLSVVLFFSMGTLLFLWELVQKFMVRRKKENITFKGKTVLVTGGSSGIGEFLTYRLNELGAEVIITARHEKELERVRKNCKFPENVHIYVLDQSNVSNAANFAKRIMKEFNNKIDILVNNAGRTVRANVIDMDPQNEKYIMDLNLMSQIAITKVIVPEMVKRKNGMIVAVSSILGKFALPTRSIYCASKFALTGYFDALRAEIQDQGIHILQVYPGAVVTQVAKKALLAEKGEQLEILEEENAQGYDVRDMAELMIESMYFKDYELIFCPLKQRLMIYLRPLLPAMLFNIAKGSEKKVQEESLEKALKERAKLKA